MLNLSKVRVNEENISERYHAFRLLNTPRRARVMTRWVLGLFIAGVLILFLPWRQNISARGQVTTLRPQDRPQTANSVIGGRILKWYVAEGQYVNEGDTLVTISEVKDEYFDTNTLIRLQEQIEAMEGQELSIDEKVAALEVQISNLNESKTLSLQKADNKIMQARLKVGIDSADAVAAKAAFGIADEQYNRLQKLYDQGLASLTDLESRRLKLQEASAKLNSAQNKYGVSLNELINSRIELGSLEAEYLEKIAKARSDQSSAQSYRNELKGKVSSLKNKYSNTEVRFSHYLIRAPQNGFVIRALRQGIGEMVKAGEPVVTIMPDHPEKAAEIYVSPNDVPLLKKGQKVRLQFDGWPALVFSGWPGVSVGTFGGEIAVIDYVNSKGGKYRVLVTPDSTEQEWPDLLRIGSGVYGWAMLDKVPIWYEIWRQLNGFPPTFLDGMGGNQSVSKEKKK